jgi:TfoX/Sxy family transcriptional regulator of competence genes
MARDEQLAHRVRELIGAEDGLSEQRMFGGLGFLLDGNLAVSASPRGLLVRVGPDGVEEALGKPGAREMEMRGRTMRGWILVDPNTLAGKRELGAWVRRGVRFARTLPAKG